MKKILIFLIMFLPIIVLADTNASYSSLRFEVEQCTSMAEETGIDEFGTCQWDHSTSLGNNGRLSFGSNNGHLKKIQMQLYAGSNVWPSGTYKFVSTIAVDPKNLDDLINYPQYYFRIYGNTTSSSSGASSGLETISSQSCYITNNTSSNYTYTVSCGFNTSKDLKYLNISMESIDNYHVPVNTNVIQWDALNVFSYNESPTGAINYQTTIIQNEFNETNNNLNNINDTLEDDDIDNPSSMIEDFEDMLPTNGTITSLIALPITLYQKILNSINGTCSSFNLGSLYGTNIIMPCIELSDYLGNTLVNTIDLMMSGFFILAISKKMIKAFNNFTSMREGDVIND